MSTHEVITTWAGDMAFETAFPGYNLRMDSPAASGGPASGASPKKLLLAAIAGCSGMDVVSILAKMKQPLAFFDMVVEGELTEEQPSYYKTMTMVYRFKEADGLDKERVAHAVELSQEKYCGVSALFKLAIPVDYRIEYL